VLLYNLFVFDMPFSTLHLFVIKIKCCVEQLKPPLKADVHKPTPNGVDTNDCG
jgi:hypothetical protein